MNEDARKIYGDIIDLPHHQSQNRKHMSLYDRAAQFAPFAALTGYDDLVKEEARLTDEEVLLSDCETEALNRKLNLIKDSLDNGCTPKVTVTYFKPDNHKSGGAYCNITAYVKEINIAEQILIFYGSDDIVSKRCDPMPIEFARIIDIQSELTDIM